MTNETKVNEILAAHGLDFHIEKAPLIAMDSEGNSLITPYFGLINTSTKEVINTCKEGYTVSQNADVVEMVLRGMEKFGNELIVSKAGSINGGRRVFMQLEINGASKIGNDYIKRYVTIIDSNDGSTGLSVGIGDLVAHCTNQFFKFYAKGNAKFRHTATLNQKIESIPYLIETALSESIKQVETYNRFISTPLTKHLADKMVKEVLGYDRVFTSVDELSKMSQRSTTMMDTLYSNIETEYKDCGENLWGLFNGLTRYTTHEMSAPKRDNGKIESLILGTAYNKAKIGFDFCLEQIN